MSRGCPHDSCGDVRNVVKDAMNGSGIIVRQVVDILRADDVANKQNL